MTKAGYPRPRDMGEVGKGRGERKRENQDLPNDYCCTTLQEPSPVENSRPQHHPPPAGQGIITQAPSLRAPSPNSCHRRRRSTNEPAPPRACSFTTGVERGEESRQQQTKSRIERSTFCCYCCMPQILKRRVPVTHLYGRFHLCQQQRMASAD
jgi:hypothetical protein